MKVVVALSVAVGGVSDVVEVVVALSMSAIVGGVTDVEKVVVALSVTSVAFSSIRSLYDYIQN